MELVKKILEDNAGIIKPLLIPPDKIIGPSIANPSILNYNGTILVNLRNLNYVLYHSEKNINEHIWGPLVYIHPEDDQTLRTHNFFCELDDDLEIRTYSLVDTSTFDVDPLWEFVGLEDARIINWDKKLFLCGVRRDTTTNGVGRMELSEICLENENTIKEISRQRIPAPGSDDSYCEKNWMPILDMPYHFIKWTNPTEVVKFNPEEKTTEVVKKSNYKQFNTLDLRGASQVLRQDDNFIALVHETDLYQSEMKRKDGSYYHRFCLWNKDFELISVSDRFNFMGAKVEFSCGMCKKNNDFIITFGFQDNCAFLLTVKQDYVIGMLK
jgi:hypothetical protein